MQELRLNDIADDLLIMSRATVDILFKQDNCADLIALYSFYYKTAKWQKTNSIKATDEYVKKCLSWGKDKVRRNKNILKELGLINIIQRREQGKVIGWYVEVNYLVTNKKSNIVIQEDLFQEDLSSRTGSQDTNALRNKIKVLEELNNNILKENKKLKNEIDKPKTKTHGTRFNFMAHVNDNWYSEAKRLKSSITDIQIKEEMDKFNDYWSSLSGNKATKVDWLATWRNWIRNSNQSFQKQKTKKLDLDW